MKGLTRAQNRLRVGVLLTLAIAVSSTPLAAVDFIVNSSSDRVDAVPGDGVCAAGGSGKCTLRAAVQEANALASNDTITLPSGRFTLSLVGGGEDLSATGDLDVLDELSIVGQGADETIIDAAGIDRVFHIHAGVTGAGFEKLTLTGGAALGTSPAPAGFGGGVLAEFATVILYRSRVSGNAAIVGGGVAGANAAQVLIDESEISGNEIGTASGYESLGGGVYFSNPNYGSLDIVRSTVSDNGCATQTAAECVGGVMVDASEYSTASTTYGLEMVNSTVSGNEGVGVGLAESDGVIMHSTIYGNSGYGLAVADRGQQLHAVSAENTIFANNGIQDCNLIVGSWTLAGGHNLSSDNTCTLSTGAGAGDQINTDPDLYPLGYYTPPAPRVARSHHPRWASPVVEAGLASLVDTEQDGYSRPVTSTGGPNAIPDIGSIEVRPCDTVLLAVDLVLATATLTAGTFDACNTITALPDVIINGTVELKARDSVILGDGFEVTAGSALTVSISRLAGTYTGPP